MIGRVLQVVSGIAGIVAAVWGIYIYFHPNPPANTTKIQEQQQHQKDESHVVTTQVRTYQHQTPLPPMKLVQEVPLQPAALQSASQVQTNLAKAPTEDSKESIQKLADNHGPVPPIITNKLETFTINITGDSNKIQLAPSTSSHFKDITISGDYGVQIIAVPSGVRIHVKCKGDKNVIYIHRSLTNRFVSENSGDGNNAIQYE